VVIFATPSAARARARRAFKASLCLARTRHLGLTTERQNETTSPSGARLSLRGNDGALETIGRRSSALLLQRFATLTRSGQHRAAAYPAQRRHTEADHRARQVRPSRQHLSFGARPVLAVEGRAETERVDAPAAALRDPEWSSDIDSALCEAVFLRANSGIVRWTPSSLGTGRNRGARLLPRAQICGAAAGQGLL
jgi:hypothetical protein